MTQQNPTNANRQEKVLLHVFYIEASHCIYTVRVVMGFTNMSLHVSFPIALVAAVFAAVYRLPFMISLDVLVCVDPLGETLVAQIADPPISLQGHTITIYQVPGNQGNCV